MYKKYYTIMGIISFVLWVVGMYIVLSIGGWMMGLGIFLLFFSSNIHTYTKIQKIHDVINYLFKRKPDVNGE